MPDPGFREGVGVPGVRVGFTVGVRCGRWVGVGFAVGFTLGLGVGFALGIGVGRTLGADLLGVDSPEAGDDRKLGVTEPEAAGRKVAADSVAGLVAAEAATPRALYTAIAHRAGATHSVHHMRLVLRTTTFHTCSSVKTTVSPFSRELPQL